jgi:hypothetical protein
MQQCTAKTCNHQYSIIISKSNKAKAYTHTDQTNVLDGAIRKHPFEIAMHSSIKNTKQSC